MKTEELLSRGVEKIYPSREFLEKRLASGEKLRVYLGIDPTGPTLHIGHLIPLLKLRDFQNAGHSIILLIGDFTGMIGDPTDKLAVRKKLSKEEVIANASLYKEQASKIISFSGDNPAELKYNSEWLGQMSFSEVIELCSKMSHAQAIKRDMFQKRISEGKDLFLHELLYPLMQGYDSVAMGVDGEVGGNDQTFNMLAGRDLAKKISGKEKFVITTKLLEDVTGAKIGKTTGNMTAFSDSLSDCFGKIMSWPDEMIAKGFELCTRVPVKDIPKEGNPKDAKMKLAYEITSLIHDKKSAAVAQEKWNSTFSEKNPQEFIEIAQKSAADDFVEKGIVESKSDLRRLISDGAITNIENGEKQSEDFLKNPPIGKYRVGKHRFVKII